MLMLLPELKQKFHLFMYEDKVFNTINNHQHTLGRKSLSFWGSTGYMEVVLTILLIPCFHL